MAKQMPERRAGHGGYVGEAPEGVLVLNGEAEKVVATVSPKSRAKPKKEVTGEPVQLERLVDIVATIPIIGLTPVIPHKWSEKSKMMMPGHPMNSTVKGKKGLRQPEVEAEGCLYRLADKSLGLPATAFKAAIVDACRFFAAPSMKECKLILFVEGEGSDQLVRVTKGELELREDTPRNANGSADLRYRYMIKDWAVVLKVRFTASSISAQSIVALVDAAGKCGVGDWRPSSPKSNTGTYGRFSVDFDNLNQDEIG